MRQVPDRFSKAPLQAATSERLCRPLFRILAIALIVGTPPTLATAMDLSMPLYFDLPLSRTGLSRMAYLLLVGVMIFAIGTVLPIFAAVLVAVEHWGPPERLGHRPGLFVRLLTIRVWQVVLPASILAFMVTSLVQPLRAGIDAIAEWELPLIAETYLTVGLCVVVVPMLAIAPLTHWLVRRADRIYRAKLGWSFFELPLDAIAATFE